MQKPAQGKPFWCAGFEEDSNQQNVADAATQLAEALLADAVELGNGSLRRAAAEAFALAAMCGSDAAAASLAQRLLRACEDASSTARRGPSMLETAPSMLPPEVRS